MSDDAQTDTLTPIVTQVTGTPPDADGAITGTIRITAVVDLSYVDGALTEIGFNSAQYTVARNGKALQVTSKFPKRKSASVSNSK